MITKKLIGLAIVLSTIALSCKDTQKEQQVLNEQLEQIETAETIIDSTVYQINQKAEEVEFLLKELDSI
jgi:hypothetical protein